ncbi:MAG: hypothetical protein V4629_02415 [Pseudomonadota bacterium]
MSALYVFSVEQPEIPLEILNQTHDIKNTLSQANVEYDSWPLRDINSATELQGKDLQEAVLNAYAEDVSFLKNREGYQTADVIRLTTEHPDKLALRQKFLSEHVHSEDEVRFFVEGSGLFCINYENRIYQLLATAGDLVRLPAGTHHWFDMGSSPSFTCIRLFTDPAGWVADFTQSAISKQFPDLDHWKSSEHEKSENV